MSHQETVHTRAMDTMVTIRDKVRDLILRMSLITKVVRLSPTKIFSRMIDEAPTILRPMINVVLVRQMIMSTGIRTSTYGTRQISWLICRVTMSRHGLPKIHTAVQ
jgi:hypothetical protein